MLDIPMFTTENGAASLILKEIPYSEAAYIKIQSSQTPETLLEECVSFCQMAGAEKIYASGHVILEKYPFHTAILEMCCTVSSIPETDAALFPLQDKTLEIWRELYNQRMKNVPNFSFMSVLDGKKLVAKGGGYFVHKSGELLGIGIAGGDRIDAVVSALPGEGETVVRALCSALPSDKAVLEVASTNERALRLYKKMGFIPTREISIWYKII